MKKRIGIAIFIFAFAFAPGKVRGQCDPDGVWLELQAYTSSTSLLIGQSGCVKGAVVISPLQVSNDTIRMIGGGTVGYVFTWNGTAWVPAATDRQTISAGDGSGSDKTINLSDGGGAVVLRPGSNVTMSRTGDTITVAATPGAGVTDLTFSGSSSPVTLNSSSGTDVTLTAGTGVSLSATSTNTTITNTAPDQTVSITGGGINNVTGTYPNFTVTGTEVDGSITNELQTLANSSDATSHTATLSNSGGSVQIIEGTGVGLSTGGTGLNGTVTVTNTAPDQTVSITGGGVNVVTGTYPNFTVTGTEVDGSTTNEAWTIDGDGGATEVISSQTVLFSGAGINSTSYDAGTNTLTVTGTEADGSVSNEGVLGVSSGGSNDANLTTTTSLGNPVNFAGGGIVNITETTSANGGTINVTATEVDGSISNELQTIANSSDATSHTVTLSNSGGSVQLIEGANITLTTGGTSGAGTVTIAATGGAANYQTVRDDGTDETQRAALNFVSTSTVNAVGTDDAGNNETEIALNVPTDGITATEIAAGAVGTSEIATNAVANADFRQSAGLSVVGRSANSTGDVGDITGTAQTVPMVQGTALGFFPIPSKTFFTTTTMPTVVGNSTEIGVLTHNEGSGRTAMAQIDIIADGSGLSSVKKYIFPLVYNSTGGAWQRLLPISANGLWVSQDFEVEMRTNTSGSPSGGIDTLRIVRTAGSVAGTANVVIQYFGSDVDANTFIATSNTSTSSVTATYGLHSISNIANKVGINTGSPARSLHVAGEARITDLTTDAPTVMIGADSDGDIGQVIVGPGLSLSGSTLSATAASANFTRTVPTTVGNTVQLGFFTKTNGAAGYDITVVVPSSGVSIAKRYIVSSLYSSTGGAWQILPPITSTGAFSGHDFVLEIKSNNALDSIRLRRTSGTTAATAYVDISYSAAAVTAFTPLSGTGNPPAITAIFNLSAIAQSANRVGIGVVAPVNKLDVEGAAVIGATYSGTNAASSNGLLVEGNVGIGNTSAQRKLHVTGEARITDLDTDPATRIVGADADGDLDAVLLTDELAITSGTLGTNFSTTITPAQITSNQTTYSPTGAATAWIWRISADDGFRIIRSITAPAFNKRITIHNVGSNTILLTHQDNLATAGNRFDFGRDYPLFPGRTVEIQYDITTARWRLVSPGHFDNLEHVYFNERFNSPISGVSGDYAFWEISSPSISGIAPQPGRLAGIGVNTGSSASGNGYVASKEVFFENTNAAGTANWAYCKAVIKTPSTLSNGTDDYTVRVGFAAGTAGGGTVDGVFFDYNHNNVSGNWGCNTTNAGNTQRNNSGITVATSTVYVLEVVCRPDLTAEFYINGTRVASNDTHVPMGTSDDLLVMSEIEKSIGTAQRDIQVFTLQTSIAFVK